MNIIAEYYNTIGILQIYVEVIDEKFKFKDLKLFHKNEDGHLTIKLSSNILKYEFSVFFSNSMSVMLRDTQIFYTGNNKFSIKYFVTKNLINRDKIIEKIQSYHITDCFSEVLSEKNWDKIDSIICSNCEKEILNMKNSNNSNNSNNSIKSKTKTKLAFNFHYDLVDNLEILSCHESEVNEVIPNLQEKLKTIVNMNNIFLQINFNILESIQNNFTDIIKDINEAKTSSNNLNDIIKCTECKAHLGSVDSEQGKTTSSWSLSFLNLYLTKISFMLSNTGNKFCINTDHYLMLMIYNCIAENIKCFKLICSDSDEEIIFYIRNNQHNFLFVCDEVLQLEIIKNNLDLSSDSDPKEKTIEKKNRTINNQNKIDKFSHLIISDVKINKINQDKSNSNKSISNCLNHTQALKMIEINQSTKIEIIDLLGINKFKYEYLNNLLDKKEEDLLFIIKI